MVSKAATVAQYLAEIPEDRRTELERVRAVILANLDPDFEEGMQYGMIGFYVPHSIHPAGYHCDPKQPLPFVNLAAQKNFLSLYLNFMLGDADLKAWFDEAYAQSGKKSISGQSCIRFKRADDLALDVIGQLIAKVRARTYVVRIEQILAERTPKSRRTAKSKPAPSPASPEE